MNTQDAKRVLETALICAQQPMPLRDMRTLFADEIGPDTLRALLDELVRDWEGRGVELVPVSTGWRFQSRPELREYLDRLHPEKPPKYSRAVMETLAIIAYRQPVTRGDIEDIRGVTVASQIIKQLEDRGWVEAIGYREAPGRPALLATTKQFLDDLGLASLEQLPLLDGTGQAGAMLEGLAGQPSLIDPQAALALDEAAAQHDAVQAAHDAPVPEAAEAAVEATEETIPMVGGDVAREDETLTNANEPVTEATVAASDLPDELSTRSASREHAATLSRHADEGIDNDERDTSIAVIDEAADHEPTPTDSTEPAADAAPMEPQA
jgi:segregation and condensation protein B